MKLEFAELHTPLFLNGKNYGTKLNSENPGDPILEYDRDEKELWITAASPLRGKKTAIIPTSNVVSMTPVGEAEPLGEPHAPPLARARGKVKAQVQTPTSHVFDGATPDSAA